MDAYYFFLNLVIYHFSLFNLLLQLVMLKVKKIAFLLIMIKIKEVLFSFWSQFIYDKCYVEAN